MTENIAFILLLVVSAIVLRGLSLSTRKRAADLAAMDHNTLEDLQGEAAAVRDQLGRGVLDKPCKVVGVARPEGQPLIGPISGQAVLWYDSKVIHHYWKDHYKTDKHGNQQHRRTKHKETLSHETSSHAPAIVDDGSGQVAINLGKARLQGTRKVVDQMRPHASGPVRGSGGPSTIGYSHVEMALLPGESLFITGHLRERPFVGGLEIVGNGKNGLLVSTSTEAEVLAGRRRVATAQAVGAAICALLALVGIFSTVSEAIQGEPTGNAQTLEQAGTTRGGQPSPSPATSSQPDSAPSSGGAAAGESEVSFTMPDLIGTDLQSAQDEVQAYGVFFSSSHDLVGTRTQVVDSNWKVCTQMPLAGARVAGDATDVDIDFGVVRREESCL